MTGGFHFPLIDFIRSVGFVSIVLFCVLPLFLGVLIGRFGKRQTGKTWACVSGVIAVIITILYQFGRTFHLLDRLGLVLGSVFAMLFIGVLLGMIIKSFTKDRDE